MQFADFHPFRRSCKWSRLLTSSPWKTPGFKTHSQKIHRKILRLHFLFKPFPPWLPWQQPAFLCVFLYIFFIVTENLMHFGNYVLQACDIKLLYGVHLNQKKKRSVHFFTSNWQLGKSEDCGCEDITEIIDIHNFKYHKFKDIGSLSWLHGEGYKVNISIGW